VGDYSYGGQGASPVLSYTRRSVSFILKTWKSDAAADMIMSVTSYNVIIPQGSRVKEPGSR
jgi:hypothetical protein